MDDEHWGKKRRRELEAAAPVKRKKAEPFVKAPLWWIAAAAKATRSPTILVLVELLYVSWRAKSPTFPLPNARLKKLGVSREVKRKALLALERAGLVGVARRHGKIPTVTLLGF
jgi:hypothetical protein